MILFAVVSCCSCCVCFFLIAVVVFVSKFTIQFCSTCMCICMSWFGSFSAVWFLPLCNVMTGIPVGGLFNDWILIVVGVVPHVWLQNVCNVYTHYEVVWYIFTFSSLKHNNWNSSTWSIQWLELWWVFVQCVWLWSGWSISVHVHWGRVHGLFQNRRTRCLFPDAQMQAERVLY